MWKSCRLRNNWSGKEYWLGKKYFEFALAEQNLVESTVDESAPELDARLQASFREYPFTETLRYIQGRVEASRFRNSSDDYEGLMTLIGSKLRKKNRSEMRTMIIGLREYKSDGVHVVRGESIAKSQDSYAEIDTAGLGRYATTLKEHGEKHGAIVRCIARPLSTYPPRYEATLMYQGTMVKAEAKSQREARQKAAMKACDKLDITVK